MRRSRFRDAVYRHVADQKATSPFRAVLTILLLSTAVALLVAAIGLTTGSHFSDLTRDPSSVAEMPVYVGLTSYVGLMGWSCTVGAAAMTALALGRLGKKGTARFFGATAGLTAWLLLDDTFMLHEDLFPALLGVSQSHVCLFYVLCAMGYTGFFMKEIIKENYMLFRLALVFLAFSLLADQIVPFSDAETFFEDTLKLTGILFWMAFFTYRAYTELAHAAQPETIQNVVEKIGG